MLLLGSRCCGGFCSSFVVFSFFGSSGLFDFGSLGSSGLFDFSGLGSSSLISFSSLGSSSLINFSSLGSSSLINIRIRSNRSFFNLSSLGFSLGGRRSRSLSISASSEETSNQNGEKFVHFKFP